jgi:hypothetical protein
MKTVLILFGIALAAVIVITALASGFQNALNDPNWLWVYLGVPLLVLAAIVWGRSRRI